jgi:DNA-binding NarL/FixJ family response regulator
MIKVLLAFEDYNELTLTESYLKKVGFDVVGISNEVLIQDQILSFNPDIIVAFGKNQKVSSFSVGQKMKENHRYHGRVVIIVPKDVRPSPNDMLKMKMDAIMEAPVSAEKLIQVLCRLSGQAPVIFLEKLNKARLTDPNFEQKLQSMPGTVSSEPHIMVHHGRSGGGGQNGQSPVGKAPSQAEISAASDILTNSEIPMAGTAAGNASPLPFPPDKFKDSKRAARYAEFLKKQSPIEIEKTSHSRQEIKEVQKDLKKDWNYEQLDNIDDLKRQFAEALFKKK